MDSISYRGMEMNVLLSLGWEREALMDQAGGTTYECTRVRGSAIVSYNPGAISFKKSPIPNGVPVATSGLDDGRMPAATDVEVRRFLEQPRGQLIVSSGDTEWLVSPDDADCDVRNGPFLKVNSIQHIQGERLWKMHISFETFINERPAEAGESWRPLILSNRWYAVDDTNWQHLRTRIYQGVCTVRADSLQGQDQPYIDFFREEFCAFNVPLGYQRESVKVTVTPDGNSAHYTVVDVEKLFSQTYNSPAVRIEVSDTNWTSLSAWRRFLATAIANSPVIRFLDWNFDENRAPAIQQAAAMALSRSYKNIIVRCWGNQITNRTKLTEYALAVAFTRMGAGPIFDVTLSELIVTGDTNNFVQVNYSISWGPADDLGQFGVPLVLADALLFGGAFIREGERSFANSIFQNPDTSANGVEIKQKRLKNPQFPGSDGTRGTSAINPGAPLFCLVTQALESFDGDPVGPADLPI